MNKLIEGIVVGIIFDIVGTGKENELLEKDQEEPNGGRVIINCVSETSGPSGFVRSDSGSNQIKGCLQYSLFGSPLEFVNE